jgi:lipopolysaccharide transport system ATP-binding protein
MQMTDTVIRVENLGKCYALGKDYKPAATFLGRTGQSVAGTFDWLIQQIRGPVPEQILWALRDVSFEIKRGEAVGFIGRNGAGKSTLLKLLSRITEPTEGFAEIKGRVGSLLEVGTGMHPELTGRENIYMNATILGMTKIEVDSKFDEIVDFSGIEKFIDTPVKRYSSGMRVRLGFAIASQLEPEILIIDEVLAVGDAEFQKKCLGKMRDVTTHGRTVLFVSHNMDAVNRLCDRGIVLSDGQKSFEGTAQDAVSNYIAAGQELKVEYEIPAPKHETPAYVYRLELEDNEGNPANEIPVAEAWQARVFLEVKETLDSFVIALGLKSETDVTLSTTWTDPQTLEPGKYQAVFREDTVHLSPGRYRLVTGLSVARANVHFVENAGTIVIHEYSTGKSIPSLGCTFLNQMSTEIIKTGR